MFRLIMIYAALTTLAAAQPGSFAVLETLYDPSAPSPAAAFDVDGDGDLDIADYRGGIHLNDGHARFAPPPYPGPSFPTSPVPYAQPQPLVRDLDGDGDLDVLMPTNNDIERWTNVGGTMTGFLPYGPTPTARPHAIVPADIDGDGDDDVVILQHTFSTPGGAIPATPMIWRNNGGAYADVTATSLAAATTALGQAVFADVDADGDLDLFLTSTGTPLCVLHTNDGTGVFTPAAASPGNIAVASAVRIAVGDVTGDGLPDVVSMDAWNAPAIFIEVNTGGGSFAPPISYPTARTLENVRPFTRDLDGDGTHEIVIPTANAGVRLYVAGPAGITGLAQVVPTVGPQFIEGDLDGDADSDFLFFHAAYDLAYGSPCQTVLGTGAAQLALVDGTLHGPGRFVADMPVFTDIDADGDTDMIQYDGNLTVHVNDGLGTLTWDPTLGTVVGVTYTVQWSQNLAPLDLDGDGDTDLVISGNTSTFGLAPVLRSLINNGTSWSPGPPIPMQPPQPSGRLAVGDFNGDGLDDFVAGPPGSFFSGFASGPPSVYLATGGGNFASPIALAPGTNVADLAVADLDNDGNLDVVQADTAAPSIISLGDGAGGFTTPLAPLPSGYTVDAADVDQDGFVDLILGGAVRRNDGTGTFPAWATLDPASWVGNFKEAIDVDGDGFDDLGSPGGYWSNAGPGFWPFVAVPGASGVAGDLDRDGDVDFFSSYPSSATIVQNLSRQLAARGPTRPGRPAGLDLHGEPNAAWQLWMAPAAGSLQIPEGFVRIDPATAAPVASGTFGPSGYAPFLVPVPNQPSLVGLSLHWQAVIFEGGGPRLTTAENTTVAVY